MESQPWAGELPENLRTQFSEDVPETSQYAGQPYVVCKPDAAVAVLRYLKEREQFDALVDITAVDYPSREARFELIYIVYSHARNQRLRVKTSIGAASRPRTLTAVFTGANWLEREVYDMFGIVFDGHPGLHRILLPEEWTGFPLRKDSSILGMDQAWVKDNLGIESGQ
ncbi:MAG: NADH-quinone oxidoreductase subunit C [Bryobacteraceae bacterium]|nr:NADH-quinone oxidoreductase subunit C [Bryobacteraceae bacterium]